MNIKILLVEDQKLMRIGIKSLFNDYPEMEVIGEAVTGKEAVEKAKLIKPDIILMDIGLTDISGIEATKQILENNSNIKVIILTSHINEQELNSSLSAGASAYVIKDISTDFLMNVIKMVKAGDKSALDFIMNKYKEVVNIKVSKYFIIGAEKEDIVQEGLIGLYKAIKSYDETKAYIMKKLESN